VHHRIDIVVVAHPEELPFARLTWTGSRSLNRLMRLRASEVGLNLNSNGLSARGEPPEVSRPSSRPADRRAHGTGLRVHTRHT
jgi:DNA polymerase/3'-5' exonuclease PolX